MEGDFEGFAQFDGGDNNDNNDFFAQNDNGMMMSNQDSSIAPSAFMTVNSNHKQNADDDYTPEEIARMEEVENQRQDMKR